MNKELETIKNKMDILQREYNTVTSDRHKNYGYQSKPSENEIKLRDQLISVREEYTEKTQEIQFEQFGNLKPGTLIRLTYGNGHQKARILGVKKTTYEVERLWCENSIYDKPQWKKAKIKRNDLRIEEVLESV